MGQFATVGPTGLQTKQGDKTHFLTRDRSAFVRRCLAVIASRVGAVEECIASDRFLVDTGADETAVVWAFIDRIMRLGRDPEQVLAEARATIEAPTVEWEDSVAPLVEAIQKEMAARENPDPV